MRAASGEFSKNRGLQQSKCAGLRVNDRKRAKSGNSGKSGNNRGLEQLKVGRHA